MASTTRRIGLSLGADICWPMCYEELMKKLDLEIKVGKDTVRFEVERVTIEPYGLRQPVKYDLVVDRLTHWYHVSREWIKKGILLDDLYVFNNPWSIQSNEKHTSYAAMMALGFPIPDTWMVPPKEYDPKADLNPTLSRYARLFDLGQVGRDLGYPMFMKPFDGGGWVGVSKIDDEAMLRAAYEVSGKNIMHLQKAVDPYDQFVRCIGLGPQINFVKYDPAAPLHDRYMMDTDFLTEDQKSLLSDMTLTINAFFGWDFNSCETLSQGNDWFPIDFANACPDSQVTSLHYHFPWLVIANLKWSIFVAATKRPMRRNLNWAPFYEIAAEKMPFRKKLTAYAAVARKHFDTDRFEEFCAEHLGHIDEAAREFFGTDTAKDAVRQKTAALYPADEVDTFTDLFWERIQQWRKHEAARPAAPKKAPAAVQPPAAAPAPAPAASPAAASRPPLTPASLPRANKPVKAAKTPKTPRVTGKKKSAPAAKKTAGTKTKKAADGRNGRGRK